jgi:SAM-dependent methyltransferase
MEGTGCNIHGSDPADARRLTGEVCAPSIPLTRTGVIGERSERVMCAVAGLSEGSPAAAEGDGVRFWPGRRRRGGERGPGEGPRVAYAQNPTTTDADYTARLVSHGDVWWKRALDVQAPYRWNLRRLNLGFTLDIGCGIGRNLSHLGRGVGIDHNPESVATARSRGHDAFLPAEFDRTEFNKSASFDSILMSHVAEHMKEAEAAELLRTYVGLLRYGGRVVLITPQEAGFGSDTTHVEFMGLAALRRITQQNGLTTVREYSFPFPRFAGRVFKYNEFISISAKR